MAIRSFCAADGVTWQVWSVVPGLSTRAERRAGYDRRSPEPVFRYTGPERRETPERRQSSPFVSPQYATGWLTFESPTEKRRLAPIPQQWEHLPDSELARLCGEARPVGPFTPPPPPS
jgi:hypothetical protein